MGILFIPMLVVGLIMLAKDPELLRRRLNSREEESEQKTVIMLSGIMFLTCFIIGGLNFIFKWIELPAIIFIIGYALYAEILLENTFLSRTVKVQENQKVIDTGLYGIVRHPMYMTTLLIFLSMPLVLGSLISFVIMFVYIPIINKRLKNEKKYLKPILLDIKII